MNEYYKKNIKLEELKTIQQSFEISIKNLEKNIAESIANKQKLDEIRKDLKKANQKFSDAEKYLDDLNSELNNNKQETDIS